MNRSHVFSLVVLVYFVSSLIAMAPMSIGAGLLCVAWLYSRLSANRSNLFLNRSELLFNYFKYSALIVFTVVLSLIYCHFFPTIIGGETSQSSLSKDLLQSLKVWHLVIPFALAHLWQMIDYRQRRMALYAYLIGLLFFSAIGLQEHFTGWPYARILDTGMYHTQGFLKFHLSYASIMAFPVFLLAAFFVSQTKNLSIIKKYLFFTMAFFLTILPLIFTFSRILWIALPIGILSVISIELRTKMAKIFVIIGLLLATILLLQDQTIQKRLSQHGGILPRVELWKIHLNLLKTNPLLGVGFRKNTEFVEIYNRHFPSTEPEFIVSHAHSNWIEVLTGTGLLGLAAWLLWWGWIFKQTWRLGPETTPSGFRRSGFLAAFIVFHINGFTQVNYWEGKVSHSWGIAIGLLLGELMLIQREKENQNL